MKKVIENKQPIPRFIVYGFRGGRFFRNQYQWRFCINFPCLPLWWRSIDRETHDKLKFLFSGFNIDCQERKFYPPIDYGVAKTTEILKYLFGYTTLQAFYRQIKKKNRMVCVNPRSKWCIPTSDLWKCLRGRYRSNEWNESCNIPKEYIWLFQPLIDQFIKSGYDPDYKPDYSIFDIGPERKPILYVCNICEHSDIRENWRWDTPPGFASHDYITHCPKCKARGTDLFEKLFNPDKPIKFQPYSKWQDDYWFTF